MGYTVNSSILYSETLVSCNMLLPLVSEHYNWLLGNIISQVSDTAVGTWTVINYTYSEAL